MAENERGFHHPRAMNAEMGGSGQGRMEPPAASKKGAREPTNHAGHTHEMSRRHESDRRIESIRGAHAGHGQQDHEKILHETHKLHNGGFTSHGHKHGEAHHWREGE
jgi:hypothetical protein